VFAAERRIDGLDIAHRIRIVRRAAPAGHADRMDRHHPDHVHAQVGDAAERAHTPSKSPPKARTYIVRSWRQFPVFCKYSGTFQRPGANKRKERTDPT